MKSSLTLGFLAAVFAAGAARADLVFTENLAIPVGSPIGLSTVGNVSGLAQNITGVNVDLNFSGGFNGNLYAYLEAPDGQVVTLLDRPGVTGDNPFGYAGSGMNVTLSDSATTGIQTADETFGGQVTGTFQAAGSLSALDGSSGNGKWTLFIADDEDGGSAPVLNSWGLDISIAAVPEIAANPAILALAGVGVLALRKFRQRKLESAAV